MIYKHARMRTAVFDHILYTVCSLAQHTYNYPGVSMKVAQQSCDSGNEDIPTSHFGNRFSAIFILFMDLNIAIALAIVLRLRAPYHSR